MVHVPHDALSYARAPSIKPRRGAPGGRYPSTLSGGQQQRTALGRAILCGPRLLLMDEPLSAQDAELRARILDYLQRIVYDLAIPTLLVSHDVDALARLGARCLHVRAGCVADTSATANA